MPDQHDDLAKARTWLDRAATWLAAQASKDPYAAALIGTGYSQLAMIEQGAAASAGAAEDNARIFGLQSVVADAHRAMESRMQAEQAEIELRTQKLAELDVATLAASGQRQARAEAEARPHDGEDLLRRAADLLNSWSTGWEGEQPEDVPATQQWLREYHQQPHPDADQCAVCNPQPGDSVPDEPTPRGEAAYLLEGDDEVFTEAEPVIVPCTCCASAYLPVFHAMRCVSGIDDGGCGHSHAEHVAAREAGRG